MALVLKDRVKETTTTTGTGTITLAGAVSGYQSFSVIGNANTTYYTIVDASTGAWEVGLGTYTLSGTTLSRDTVLESSNSGSLVNFGAGTKEVFVTYPAERAVVSGTTDYLSLPAPSTSGNVLTANGTAWTSAAPSGGGSTLTINNKTTAYTVISTDAGKVINCTSGTFTVSLTTATSLGSGFNCWIWNTGTGVITIDPNLSETIDGVTTLTLQPGEGTQIVCDGTNWQTGDKKTMRGYAENFTTNSARPMAVGTWSISLGRSYASGTEATAISIGNNTSIYGATGPSSIAIGTNAAASGQNSIAISNSSSSNANYATAIGQSALATAYRGFALGAYSYAEIIGKYAYSAGNISSTGDAQRAVYLLRRNSTSATPVVLTTDTGAPSASNQIALQFYGAYAFTGMIVAAKSVTAGAGAVASWKIEGLLRKGSSNGTTQLINSAVTVISNTPGWSIALSADTTNGALAITVTGAAATNIYWLASIDVTELVY